MTEAQLCPLRLTEVLMGRIYCLPSSWNFGKSSILWGKYWTASVGDVTAVNSVPEEGHWGQPEWSLLNSFLLLAVSSLLMRGSIYCESVCLLNKLDSLADMLGCTLLRKWPWSWERSWSGCSLCISTSSNGSNTSWKRRNAGTCTAAKWNTKP